MIRVSKSVRNVPLREVNNFCYLYDCELDIENEEIIIMEVDKKC